MSRRGRDNRTAPLPPLGQDHDERGQAPDQTPAGDAVPAEPGTQLLPGPAAEAQPPVPEPDGQETMPPGPQEMDAAAEPEPDVPEPDMPESGAAGGTGQPDHDEPPAAAAAQQSGLAAQPAAARHARPDQRAELGGRVFGWLTVMPALLVAAWLLPGLPLLLAGRFLPLPVFVIAAPLAALFAVVAARYVPGRWPGPARRSGPASTWAAWWGLGGTVAVAAGFGVWQFRLNSPQLILVRTPGVFTQLGNWIAQHGELPIPVTPAAFGGSHAGLSFASYGFAEHGAALAPWQQPGLPIVLAAGAWLHGLAGLTAISPVLGVFGVLTVAGLTGRLAGLAWAPVGALVAALALPQILTSRSAYAEPLVQLLVFGGLCLIADSLAARPRDAAGRLADWVRWPILPPAAATMAGLGGLSLGLASLTQAAVLLILLPVIPFAAALVGGPQPRAAAFTIGVIVGAGYGLAGGLLLTGPGIGALVPSLRLLGLAVVCVAAATLVAIAIGYRDRLRRVLGKWPWRWLPAVVAVVVVGVAIAFAVRPYVQVMRGTTTGAPYVRSLQRLAGLPADPRRLYSEDSLYWVIWYLGLPAVLLAVAGLAMLARRCARALIRWSDPDQSARMQTLPMLIIGWGVVVTLWQPGTVPDQPWASRTLVPVVLPGLIVSAIWAAAWLAARAKERGAGRAAVGVAAAFFIAALAVPGAITSFGAGAPAGAGGSRLAIAGVALGGPAAQRTNAGQAAALRGLCGQIGENSSAVLLDQTAAREYAPVLRGMCGVPAGVMVGASPGQVLAVMNGIAQAGRRPVLLASAGSALLPYRARPRPAVNLLTRQDAHFLTRPPDGTWPVRYELWISSPAPGTGGA